MPKFADFAHFPVGTKIVYIADDDENISLTRGKTYTVTKVIGEPYDDGTYVYVEVENDARQKRGYYTFRFITEKNYNEFMPWWKKQVEEQLASEEKQMTDTCVWDETKLCQEGWCCKSAYTQFKNCYSPPCAYPNCIERENDSQPKCKYQQKNEEQA